MTLSDLSAIEDREALQRRTLNVLRLGVVPGQAAVAGTVAVVSLLAKDMLGSDRLAGLGSAAFTFGSAMVAIPLAAYMRRNGRRDGLALALGIGALGALGAHGALGVLGVLGGARDESAAPVGPGGAGMAVFGTLTALIASCGIAYDTAGLSPAVWVAACMLPLAALVFNRKAKRSVRPFERAFWSWLGVAIAAGILLGATAGMQAMGAEAFAGSTVLRVHEFGEDIRTTGKLMAVSVASSRPKSPKAWQARYPGKKLVFRPSKKNPGEGLLFEATTKRQRGRGRPRKGAPIAALREQLKLRWVLKRFVDMKPTLNFYGMWGALQPKREQLWRGAAQRMEAQLQQGNPRDF